MILCACFVFVHVTTLAYNRHAQQKITTLDHLLLPYQVKGWVLFSESKTLSFLMNRGNISRLHMVIT
jgi:hypothetical protein